MPRASTAVHRLASHDAEFIPSGPQSQAWASARPFSFSAGPSMPGTTSLWRYLNGKSVCRGWAVYEQMLQHMSERNRVALPRERLREIQTLWRRAVIRAGELRAERRAGGPVPSVVERGQPVDRPRTPPPRP